LFSFSVGANVKQLSLKVPVSDCLSLLGVARMLAGGPYTNRDGSVRWRWGFISGALALLDVDARIGDIRLAARSSS